jgi:hypothetical protein
MVPWFSQMYSCQNLYYTQLIKKNVASAGFNSLFIPPFYEELHNA